MDILTAIVACNLYTSDDPLVRAITQSTSRSNPYFVLDPVLDYELVEVPPEPKTLEAAKARLADITSKGGHPLLGLMQVLPAWMIDFGRSVTDAFDPCINISIGTAVLSAMDHECSGEPATRPLPAPRRRSQAAPLSPREACVLRKYAEATGLRDLELVIRLELGAQHRRHRVVARGAPTDVPIIFPEASQGWGADRIFLSVESKGKL